MDSTIKYYRPAMENLQTNSVFQLKVVSDASMNEKENKTNVREGILTFRRLESSVHNISWSSKAAGIVTHSFSVAGLLTATDATGKVTYLKHILEKIQKLQRTILSLDSKTTDHLCFTHKEPVEARKNINLTPIREEYHPLSMATIRWAPRMVSPCSCPYKRQHRDERDFIWNNLFQELHSSVRFYDNNKWCVPQHFPPKVSTYKVRNDGKLISTWEDENLRA